MTKSPDRVACEQAVLEVVQTARRTLWTLRQLRAALRARRRALMAPYRGARRRRIARGWYAAVRAVCSTNVKRLAHPKQLALPMENAP